MEHPSYTAERIAALERQIAEYKGAEEVFMAERRAHATEISMHDETKRQLAEAFAQVLAAAVRELADELKAGAHILFQEKALLAVDRDWLLAKAQKARDALDVGKEAGG